MSAGFAELRRRMHEMGGDAQEFAELTTETLAQAEEAFAALEYASAESHLAKSERIAALEAVIETARKAMGQGPMLTPPCVADALVTTPIDSLVAVRAEARAAAFEEAAQLAVKPAGNKLMSHQDRQFIIAERIRRAGAMPA